MSILTSRGMIRSLCPNRKLRTLGSYSFVLERLLGQYQLGRALDAIAIIGGRQSLIDFHNGGFGRSLGVIDLGNRRVGYAEDVDWLSVLVTFSGADCLV